MKTILLAAAFAVALPAQAATTLLTFDTLSGFSDEIGNGYGGLQWSNFYSQDAVSLPSSGYKFGMVSERVIAYNGGGSPASISSNTDFRLLSGYLTGAWNNGLTVTVQGYNNSTLIFTQNFVVPTTAPTLVSFNNAFVDSVVFSSGGGTPAGYIGSGTHFVLDNLTLGASAAVPEPQSWALMIAGFGLVGVSMRRRKVALAA